MSPPKLRQMIGKFADPNLSQIVDIAAHFDVSKHAAARAYAEYQDQHVAIAVIKDAKVLRIYRNIRFPKIGVSYGAPVPRDSLFHLAATRGAGCPTSARTTAGYSWNPNGASGCRRSTSKFSSSRRVSPC